MPKLYTVPYLKVKLKALGSWGIVRTKGRCKLSIRDNISAGAYSSQLPWEPRDPVLRKAHLEDRRRLEKAFKDDLLADLNLTGHPQAEILFNLAWDYGHANGFEEVLSYAVDMAPLLTPMELIKTVRETVKALEGAMISDDEMDRLHDQLKIELNTLK